MPAKHQDERRPRSESGPLRSALPSAPVHSWQPLNYYKSCYSPASRQIRERRPRPRPTRRALGVSGAGPPRSTKRGDELVERDHLAAACGGRHEDDRPHAGRAPRLDAVADVLGAAEQRHVGQQLAHVVQRLARLDAETVVSRPVADADAEAEAAARQLVDDRRRLRPLERVTRVDVGDAGVERDLAGDEGQRLAEREPVAGARTVDAGEAFRLEALREIERRPPPSSDGDEAHGRLAAHEPRRRGSSVSRSASPSRVVPNTARLMARPGQITSHGAFSAYSAAAIESMRPHEGYGSGMPSPRNESAASTRIEPPSCAVARTMNGPIVLGRM